MTPGKTGQPAQLRRLLDAQGAAGYYQVSLRKFHELRAAGLVPEPVVLGPRLLRWVVAELDESLKRLPRTAMLDRPASLDRRQAAQSDTAGA